ncbi:MAG: hypothetical protein VW397_08375, partial [Candidatus Margulisiibacteriota bacterium]
SEVDMKVTTKHPDSESEQHFKSWHASLFSIGDPKQDDLYSFYQILSDYYYVCSAVQGNNLPEKLFEKFNEIFKLHGKMSLKFIRNIMRFISKWVYDSGRLNENNMTKVFAKILDPDLTVLTTTINAVSQMCDYINNVLFFQKNVPEFKILKEEHETFKQLIEDLIEKDPNYFQGYKPRHLKLFTWILPGLKLHSPIPKLIEQEHSEFMVMFDHLYAVTQMRMVLLNAMIDDIADDLRDEEFVKLALSIFPDKSSFSLHKNVSKDSAPSSEESPSIEELQSSDEFRSSEDQEVLCLTEKEDVKNYLKYQIAQARDKGSNLANYENEIVNLLVYAWEVYQRIFKEFNQMINQIKLAHKLKQSYGLSFRDAIPIAWIYPIGKDLCQIQDEEKKAKFAEILSTSVQHTWGAQAQLTLNDYFDEDKKKKLKENLISDLLRDAGARNKAVLPENLLAASATKIQRVWRDHAQPIDDRLSEALNKFGGELGKKRSNSFITRDPITNLMLIAYSDLFENFLQSVQFNKKPELGTHYVHSAHHNMNIIIFFQSYMVTYFTCLNQDQSEIEKFITNTKILEICTLIQKLSRFDNVLATCVPNKLFDNDDVIPTSRELDGGDISGMVEILEMFSKDPSKRAEITSYLLDMDYKPKKQDVMYLIEQEELKGEETIESILTDLETDHIAILNQKSKSEQTMESISNEFREKLQGLETKERNTSGSSLSELEITEELSEEVSIGMHKKIKEYNRKGGHFFETIAVSKELTKSDLDTIKGITSYDNPMRNQLSPNEKQKKQLDGIYDNAFDKIVTKNEELKKRYNSIFMNSTPSEEDRILRNKILKKKALLPESKRKEAIANLAKKMVEWNSDLEIMQEFMALLDELNRQISNFKKGILHEKLACEDQEKELIELYKLLEQSEQNSGVDLNNIPINLKQVYKLNQQDFDEL